MGKIPLIQQNVGLIPNRRFGIEADREPGDQAGVTAGQKMSSNRVVIERGMKRVRWA